MQHVWPIKLVLGRIEKTAFKINGNVQLGIWYLPQLFVQVRFVNDSVRDAVPAYLM